MKRGSVLFAGVLATLLLSTLGCAKSASDSNTRGSMAPAEKPSILALPHNVTGQVVSVDRKNNNLVVKDSEGKRLTLVADRDTAAELSRVKAGDPVKVTYKKSNGQMVMTKITSDTDTRRTSQPR
jgi:hypothetical protein